MTTLQLQQTVEYCFYTFYMWTTLMQSWSVSQSLVPWHCQQFERQFLFTLFLLNMTHLEFNYSDMINAINIYIATPPDWKKMLQDQCFSLPAEFDNGSETESPLCFIVFECVTSAILAFVECSFGVSVNRYGCGLPVFNVFSF